jgi:DNA-binding transcriptional MerR regulator
MPTLDEQSLQHLEQRHAAGLSSVEILDVFARHEVALSEATLRKYVQLGLLPRSVRVGRKGKHQGSQGIYPVGVVRQILAIKQMMAEDYTIEQIQREFLFMRSDLRALEQILNDIFKKLAGVLAERKREGTAAVVVREVSEAKERSKELLERLGAIEERLTARAEKRRAAAG